MYRKIGSGLLTLTVCATLSVGCSNPEVDYPKSDGSTSPSNSNIEINSSSNEVSETDGCEHYSGKNPSWEELINDYKAAMREMYARDPQSTPEHFEKEWQDSQFFFYSRDNETNASKEDIYSVSPPDAAATIGKMLCETLLSKMHSNSEYLGNEDPDFYLKNPAGAVMNVLMACRLIPLRGNKIPELYQSSLNVYEVACPQYL